MRVIDVTDPANPSAPAAWPSNRPCHSVLLEEGRISVLTSYEMLMANADFPEPVLPLATSSLDSYPYRQVLADDLLYFLQQGLHITDVSDPAWPVEIGFFSDSNHYSRMSLAGSVIYLSAMGEAGVIAVDVSDPTSPVKLSTLTNEETYSIHAANGLVAVGPRSGFVSLYDVSDPAAPVLLGTHAETTAYRAYGVAIVGDHIYMTTGTTQVLDISDPGNIQTVASLSTGFGSDLVADGEWVYTGGNYGVSVLKFSAPNTLELMATQPIPEYVQDLHLLNGVLAVACKKGGVHIFDVNDPVNIVRIGAITAAEDARCVAASTDLIVVGNSTYPVASDGMIEIYPVPCEARFSPAPRDNLPASAIVLSATPNPFNPRVRFSFNVPQAGHAKLSIFDLRGRCLVTLVDAHIAGGQQYYDWNGLDMAGRQMASGGYIARLFTESLTISRQVTLVR